MLKILTRTAVASLLAAALGLGSVAPAMADGADALANSIVAGANAGIKAAMSVKKVPKGTVAQVPPVQQQPVGGPAQQGLPTGFTYTADVSAAYPYGNIGKLGKAWLPGGVDLVAGYGFNPTTRVVASYYELQHYPTGFDSGTVPLYLQGQATPLDPSFDLSQANINVTTKDRFLILSVEKLFSLNMGSRTLPIVISPTYVARTSKIAASPSNNDIVPFETNPPNGFPVLGVYTRTAQYYSLAFTVPFLKTSKMFGTFTAAPTTLVHMAGLNQVNKPQIYQILYLEYTPTDRLRFFFEPQSSRDYLPTDYYAQHLPAYFLGAAERIGRSGFVQLVLNSGGPTNESPYGVTALTCQALPCSSNAVIPTIGGLKATQIQIQFGIGSPSYIPF